MDKYSITGAVVIMDINTFDILACASRPGFNPLNPQKYLDSKKGELLNRAFQPYNAGSVFKIVTACSAIEQNPHYKDRFFYCNGSYSPDGITGFSCHKNEGHKIIYMPQAFAKSCNCAFYETALCTGGENIKNTAVSLGLGRKVLSVNMDESNGNIPEKNAFSPYELMNLSIGQGEILITPLQCTQMTAIIANKGIKKQTNLVKEITDENNRLIKKTYVQKETRAISAQTSEIIGEMMRETVICGTAEKANDCSVNIAGKTGSAETGWKNADGSLKVHGWFCGFFPYENPRYAMTVFCEDGKSGAGSCVEPFTEIAEIITNY